MLASTELSSECWSLLRYEYLFSLLCALEDFGENVCKHVLANNNFQAFVEEKAGFLNSH